MRMLKYLKIPFAIAIVAIVFTLGMFTFGRDTALANFVVNSWQGYKLTSGLVGYWSFDGQDMDLASSTREVFDRSGNNFHGDWKEHATTTTIGKIGQGIDFDGSNDYVSTGDFGTLDVGDTADFTIAGWFYRETSDTADTIIAKRDSFNAADVGYIIDIALASDRIVLEVSDGTDEYFMTSVSTFGSSTDSATNTGWNHFVMVFDQDSAANSTVYINGRADLYNTSGTIGNIGDLTNSRPLQIGARSDDNAPFDGRLDEIRLYNRTLSADEAKRLYLMGASTKVNVSHRDELADDLLFGNWTFDGKNMDLSSSTGEIYDVSTWGNHADWKNHSTTTTIGKIGQGIQFDGIDDYIDAQDKPGFDFSDASSFTISGWFYRDTQTTADTLIFKRQGILAAYPGYGAYITSASDQLNFEVSDGTDEYSLDSVTTFKNPGWYHFAIVWDPDSAENTEIYINGVDDNAADTGTIANIGDLSNSRVLAIGAQSDGNNNFIGKLDDFRLYRRVLTPDEIKRLYLMGASMKVNVSHRDELTNGLVGYWTFDGRDMDLASSTREVFDRSGNNNNGDWKEHATTTAIGKIGQAINFDGTNDFVSVPDVSSLEFDYNVDFSVSIWVKIPTTQSDMASVDNSILEKWLNAGDAFPYTFRLYNQTYGVLQDQGKVLFKRFDLTNAPSVTSTARLNDNIWHLLTATKSGTTLSLYVDGVLVGTATDTTTTTTTNAAPLTIGERGNNNYSFRGSLDELRIYNRALSADEAKRLYLMGK